MVAVLASWSVGEVNAANCNASTLSGTWQYHALNTQVGEDGETTTFVEDCSFEIDDHGVITEATCTDIGADFSDFYKGGRFEVYPRCGLRSVIGDCEFRGQVTADKLSASGVGACTQFNFYFDLVKGGN
jgi:hypothetical protein